MMAGGNQADNSILNISLNQAMNNTNILEQIKEDEKLMRFNGYNETDQERERRMVSQFTKPNYKLNEKIPLKDDSSSNNRESRFFGGLVNRNYTVKNRPSSV